jgi:hypothetical protein
VIEDIMLIFLCIVDIGSMEISLILLRLMWLIAVSQRYLLCFFKHRSLNGMGVMLWMKCRCFLSSCGVHIT